MSLGLLCKIISACYLGGGGDVVKSVLLLTTNKTIKNHYLFTEIKLKKQKQKTNNIDRNIKLIKIFLKSTFLYISKT